MDRLLRSETCFLPIVATYQLSLSRMRLSALMLVLIVMIIGTFSSSTNADWNRKVSSTTKDRLSLDKKTNGITRTLQELATINKPEVGSESFALVDSYDCNNDMVAIVRKFFKANDATFNKCISDSGYQIYPYTGTLPDSKTIVGLVNSNACMGIVTAVVLLNMPPCILEKLAMRAACETILHYSMAMRNGAGPPTAEQFKEVMTWRRDVDLARAANKPFDGRSETFAVFTRNLRKAIVSSKVAVMKNYTVVLDEDDADFMDGKQLSFVSTNSSKDYFVGRVVASEQASDDLPTVASTELIFRTQTSDSVTVATASMTFAMTLALAAAFI
ncbi:unnamed protein product [Peronospora farinosa]|uniref:Elicitin n=2 Tax=Peronospora farinosa TaxID=134698 RepID=A0AAV0TYP9_9STRA|nr:unnamed protein product [Peronospora farinosa]